MKSGIISSLNTQYGTVLPTSENSQKNSFARFNMELTCGGFTSILIMAQATLRHCSHCNVILVLSLGLLLNRFLMRLPF